MDIQYAGALRQGTMLLMRRQMTENSLKKRHTVSHTHCVVVVWLSHDDESYGVLNCL